MTPPAATRARAAARMTCLALAGAALHAATPPAFPGAEGFGATATGGRGGEIIHVTNLNDAGPGSFRDAVAHGKRTVVFDVAGYINLSSPVGVASDLTIAGQSAPGEGIGTRNYEVSFSKSHNIIVRHIRFRQGTDHGNEKKYAVGMTDSHDVILDHVSIEWGRWDCIGLSKSKDITIQYCLIGEGAGPQCFGCLCESENVTFSHNLWIDNRSRNPKAKGTVQYVNNIVYNWGVTGYVGGHSAAPHRADLIGNLFLAGPSSSQHFAGEFTATDLIYQSNNQADLDRDGRLNSRPAAAADFPGATLVPTPAMTPPVPVTIDTPADALRKVVATAGASLHRDAADIRLIAQLKSLGKSGAIIRDLKEIGGYGDIKTAPARPLQVAGPNEMTPAGYTKIEESLNSLATQAP